MPNSSLLGISALASGQHHVPSREIIILPLLFTAGMTALDSLDSVFMLSAYTMPQRVVEAEYEATAGDAKPPKVPAADYTWKTWIRSIRLVEKKPTVEEREEELRVAAERAKMLPHTDQDKLVNISVVLTMISIVVALIISIVSLRKERDERRHRQTEADFSNVSLPADRIHGVSAALFSLLLAFRCPL